MTDKVTSLSDYRPHKSGAAICLQCKHEWQAVTPLETMALECPKCGLEKGVFQGFAVPEVVYQCSCGNHHFYIHPDGLMCSLCGNKAEP